MQLLVVRHAIAEDREAFAAAGRGDAHRPLTAKGSRRMRRAARGLRHLVRSVDVIVSSPYTRAAETAEILRRAYKIDEVQTAGVLKPGAAVADTARSLERYSEETVLLVGHEPHLGRLVAYLVAGVDRSAINLKKGGACLIEFDALPRKGQGRLMWLLPPAVLRDLAG